MATKTWIQLFGANATYGSDGGGVFVKFYVDGMATTTGITPANINNANAAEKCVATLVKFWASLTYDETNNVTVAQGFPVDQVLQTAQRNNTAKWVKGYDINLYASAPTAPTTIDPDDV
jgi:hypothetical protein